MFTKQKAKLKLIEIKVVRSDNLGKFNGKYDETSQYKGPFFNYLQEHEIVA